MEEYDLTFSFNPSSDTGAFKLMALPPELCKLIESTGDGECLSLNIKGQSEEDAVLCTLDKTYTIRSVVLSNSVLVVTPPAVGAAADRQNGEDVVVIRDQLNEILELVPSVPRLHRLNGLLRGREYDEGHEDEDEDEEDVSSDAENARPRKRQKFSYEDARETLQASDIELHEGLRARRVLVLDGELRPIAPSHLNTILELLLNYLVSLSLPHDAADIKELASALEDDHDIKKSVSTQVMGWFGQVSDGKWKMDVDDVVKGVGVGILRTYKDEPIAQDDFLGKWRKTVGDTFEARVSLNLLSGNYLSNPSYLTEPPTHMLTYFPSSSLPVDPATRFTDLFLTRARWKAEEISPFLADIVVNSKERDKLLLKYARAITDTEGIWYTARAKYNG
ncbi:putative sister chromatid cohesion protein DCC1 [Grifola frondosa]|uniref:Putative sister chromatid cohesion protein DCC1 n=1 Tax=Grifola frondosa TaxID=5627 RepID=A0A1C7LQF3_GRIFR|nr:putative sister chromatid cohesion protein DCC1 [Grifola frondosa]